MKFLNCFVVLTILIATGSFISAQAFSSKPAEENKGVVTQAKERRVQLAPYATVILPANYKAYRTGGRIDYWFGYIESEDGSFRINYLAGMVESAVKDEKEFQWLKEEKLSKLSLLYGRKSTKEGDMVAAEIGWTNFTTKIKNDNDIGVFLKIVRTYKQKPCEKCEPALYVPSSEN